MNITRCNFVWRTIGAIFIFYLVVMMMAFHISAWTIIKYVFLTIFSILLPGSVVLSFTRLNLSRVGCFCTAYIFGYAVVVLEYFFSELFNRALSFLTINCIITIISLVYMIVCYTKNRQWIQCKKTEHDNADLFFFVLFLGLNILSYAARYLGPDVVPVSDIYTDMLFWTNNTVSLKIAWPADSLFMAGYPLNYHYFSSVPLAFFSTVYGIDVFTLSFPLYVITKTVMMVGAVCFLLDSIQANNEQSIFGYILVLCTTGAERICVVTYLHHTLLSPFGFDIGYAYGIIFVTFLLRQWRCEGFENKIFLGTIMTWGMCVGAKAPLALVLLLFAGLVCFYWFLKRKWTLAFGYGTPILGLFFLICKYCVGMFAVAKGDALWHLSLYDVTAIKNLSTPEAWDIIGKAMVYLGSKNVVLACLVRIFSLNPAVIVAVVLSVVAMIQWNRWHHVSFREIYLQVILGVTALWGLSLGLFVNTTGKGEMYFSMAALIPMSVMIFISVRNYESVPLMIVKDFWGYKLLFGLFSLLICMGIYRYSFSAWDNEGAIRTSWRGVMNLYHAVNYYDYSRLVKNGIRKTDVDALRWLRDHTIPNALVMSDKAVMTNNPQYYYYGVFCERQQYLEGFAGVGTRRMRINEEVDRRKEIISNVYQNKDGAIQVAAQEGIDYIVQTIDITPDFIYDRNLLELVKSTTTMNIYKIKR